MSNSENQLEETQKEYDRLYRKYYYGTQRGNLENQTELEGQPDELVERIDRFEEELSNNAIAGEANNAQST